MMFLWPSFHDAETTGIHQPGRIPQADFSLVVHITSIYSWNSICFLCLIHGYPVGIVSSIYFFVIQLPLRMIDFEGKKKTAS